MKFSLNMFVSTLYTESFIANLAKKLIQCSTAHYLKNGSVLRFIINFNYLYNFPATHKYHHFKRLFVSTLKTKLPIFFEKCEKATKNLFPSIETYMPRCFHIYVKYAIQKCHI